ncbi:hypothetical protein JOQ06_022367 [Pogonophryne albipinna]|uniref:Uncharacterized protein n=1 Tax=Pogonophryne albipinna TaxID=1090488 RepID=A0AAD6A491_9TELE|nr:hypothetical protein JOQ06_022367 [Pogonophryne albipinna]
MTKKVKGVCRSENGPEGEEDKISNSVPGQGIVVYGSAEEATEDMAKRGLPVSVIKHPDSLLERIQQITWRTSKRLGTLDRAGRDVNYKEKLGAFRHKDSA